jgi:two-component system response regulator RegA
MMSLTQGDKLMISINVLIVDQQDEFVESCRVWLEPEGGRLQPAQSYTDAVHLLETEPIDLALIELSSSDPTALEILRFLTDRGSDLPVIVTSAHDLIPLDQVMEAFRLDSVAFIRKPCRQQTLLDTVRQVLRPFRPGAVSGNLRDLSLPNLISLICHEGKQAQLEIDHAGQAASIFFEKGQMVHAQLNEQSGQEAIFEALTWYEGQFVMTMGQSPPEHSIQISWSNVLMEGLKRLDEAAFDQEQLDGSAKTDPTFWADEPVESPALSHKRARPITLDDPTLERIDERLIQLNRELALNCTLFLTRTGHLLYSQSEMDDSQLYSLAALAAGSFSATDEVAKLISRQKRDQPQFKQSLQEGPDNCLYSARVGAHWILTVAFNPDKTNLGLARRYTLQAVSDLEEFLIQAGDAVDGQLDGAGDFSKAFSQDIDTALDDLFDQTAGAYSNENEVETA